MLWLSIGENCLTDDILRRHGKKSFSTPYSHGRSNVDYALQLERDGYEVLLDKSQLVVGDAWGDRVVRSTFIINSSPIFDDQHRVGFEFTHHDVLCNDVHYESVLRKIDRLKSIRGKNNVVFFYHHRINSQTNIEKIRKKLIDFQTYYNTLKAKCFIVLFYQNIVTNLHSRRITSSNHSDQFLEYIFHTYEKWGGVEPNLFWARNDDDLIEKMITDINRLTMKQLEEAVQARSCNICGSSDFIAFNGRTQIQCSKCKSLERHRLVRWTLENLGYLFGSQGVKRALHLAPEEMTHRYLAESLGVGYVCSDLVPEKYPHAQCLKLALPEGFGIFPDNYFDLILHNHVLEHIPGNYRDHLTQFSRLLRPGGHMVFTLPGISRTLKTVEGGENLPSDEDRVRLHGQSDHYKTFCCDLIEWFNNASGVFSPMEISTEVRTALRAPYDSIYVFLKM